MYKTDLKRRDFLNYLMASPALAIPFLSGCDQSPSGESGTVTKTVAETGANLLPENVSGVGNVFELRDIAEKTLPAAHFGYMQAAAGGGATARANLSAFDAYTLRSRRLQGITTPDTSVTVLGEAWPLPFALAPAGSQNAFHPEGEMAVARAAKSTGVQMVLSTLATHHPKALSAVKGSPLWQQLYPLSKDELRARLLADIKSTGCNTIMLTVDDIGGRGADNFVKMSRQDPRDCTACHASPRTPASHASRKPLIAGMASETGFNIGYPGMDLEFLSRVRDQVSDRLLVKGILDARDAEACVKLGVDGIVVSNHGGRIGAAGEGSLTALPAIAKAVDGRCTVLFDSGIRRGADIFKALALGADAVMIGRPYLWGLGAFGKDGVEAAINMLGRELRRTMTQAGTARISDIGIGNLKPA